MQYGMLDKRTAYVHVRRCKEDLPQQMDEALAKVGSAAGLVLDFRGNSGGGFDHEGFMGRFVPKGKDLAFVNHYASAGPNPYAGPIVVIVDATVVSAGETASGIFKEDGRAYMIGESATAGMSSQKTTIELPSGLYGLYVSTSSNKGRFNGGKGIEGVGVIPHEILELDPKDLAAGVDTLIKRAQQLLAKFPQDKVPYKVK
jgi:C-terminal processing protease CtpA/Prc